MLRPWGRANQYLEHNQPADGGIAATVADHGNAQCPEVTLHRAPWFAETHRRMLSPSSSPLSCRTFPALRNWAGS